MLDMRKGSFSSKEEVLEAIALQRKFFSTGKTQSLEYRLYLLAKLKKVISENETLIGEALKQDLNKPELEAYVSETGFVLEEINYAIKKLHKWIKPRRVKSPVLQQPCRSFIKKEPLGTVLIIGPWNYPFQLILAPLVGAIAAGNTAILKPSELAPATSKLIKEIFHENFARGEISVIEGAIDETNYLLDEKFDYIFYTGSGMVGKIIMEKAAKHLTPVTLELGGKSPCMIFGDLDLNLVARRIAWGKFINGGQTCVAPDYVLIEKKNKDRFVTEMKAVIREYYGENPAQSPDYCRIINEHHFKRLASQIIKEDVLIGGETDESQRYIAPTVLNANEDSPIMSEEIFGPLLPIVTVKDVGAALNIINKKPKPLALYLFTNDSKLENVISTATSSGGLLINDTIVHLTNNRLPFGGVGASGIGAYHGKFSFDIFSHNKSVMKRYLMLDVALRYPPYFGKLKIIRWLMKYFG